MQQEWRHQLLTQPRRQRGGYLLLESMVATFIGALVLMASISLVVTGAAAADSARQNNAAYNAARQVIENMRLRRGAQLVNNTYSDATVFGPVPQLAYLRNAGTPSATVSTWRGSVKMVTVTITWRAGRGGGIARSRTVTSLISPKGISL